MLGAGLFVISLVYLLGTPEPEGDQAKMVFKWFVYSAIASPILLGVAVLCWVLRI